MTINERWSSSFADASIDAMRAYDDIMVPRIFSPWAEVLLDHVTPAEGESLLDLACGPGTVARIAAQRLGPLGRVTGCDLSHAMLEIARSKPRLANSAPIEYLECPADSLPIGDAMYDVVTCQQGVQFFGDRPAALRELRRALRSGGRLGIAVWCDLAQCPPFAALGAALGEVLGTEAAINYRRGPWGLPDGEELRELVEQAGFAEVTLTEHRRAVEFDEGPLQLIETLRASSLARDLALLDEPTRQAFVEAVEKAALPLMQGGKIQSELTSHIVVASAT